MPATQKHYAAVAIGLHWTIAAAILFMIWLGWNMDENEARYQLHKSVGITILVLTLARISWRVLNPPPPLPDTLSVWERRASHAVHLGFYGLMLALPLTGWLYVSTAQDFDIPTVLFGLVSWPDLPFPAALNPVLEAVHSRLAWLALLLLGLHVAGALKHEFTSQDGVLRRMLPAVLFSSGEPTPTRPGSRRISFGLALAFFVLIAAVPFLDRAPTSVPAGADGTAEFSPNWQVDRTASQIVFSGLHDGAPYTGTFANWTARIRFDPDQPEMGKAVILIQTNSVDTNKKLYTDSLKSPEWFNVPAYPVATATVSNIVPTEAGYGSDVVLTIKDRSVTAPFLFQLELDGTTAVMTGTAEFGRTPLDLGLTSDPDGDWVDETVRVSATLTASPID